jgi:hypothetical protein
MSQKKVTAVVGKDGKMAVSFNGFSENACYDEAEKIKSVLRSLGVDIDVQSIIPNDESAEQIKSTKGVLNEQKH